MSDAILSDPRFAVIPGTRFIYPAGDTNFRTRASAGSMDLERVATLPGLQKIRAGSVVVDVGAYIGDTVRPFLDMGCSVFAFEPFEDAFTCLKHNCPEAVAFNEACGNGEPIALGPTPAEGNYGMRAVVIDGQSAKRALRLDDLYPSVIPRVDFLKVDCEGFEFFALHGAATIIRKCRPVIAVEAFPEKLALFGCSVYDILHELMPYYRFEVVGIPPIRWDYVCSPL